MRRLRRGWLLVWVAPASCVGLAAWVVAVLRREPRQLVDGVLEVASPTALALLDRWAPWVGPIAAITLGHVVVGRDPATLAQTRRHERVHVRQYERWGPLFIPLYLLSSLWVWTRGGHPYLDNPFEVEAYRADGIRF